MGNSDSRTIFRDQVQMLVNEDIPQDRSEFWDMLFGIQITLSDVYSMIPDADIHNLLTSRRENMVHLIDFCITILDDAATTNDLKGIKLTTASNCTKILIRLLPHVLKDNFIMWSEQFRALRIMSLALKLLFTPGYTVSANIIHEITDHTHIDVNRLWGSGLGRKVGKDMATAKMWNNRYDLLRLLLGMVGFELFKEGDNLYALYLISKSNLYATQLTVSVINAMISFKPMGGWNLPYNGYFNYEYEEKTVQVGLQLISTLLLSRTSELSDISPLIKSGIVDEDLSENVILKIISSLESDEDLLLLYTSLKDLITVTTISQNTYLPSSVKDLICKNELGIFLWDLIKVNKKFKSMLGSYPDCYELVLPLVQMLDTSDFIVTSSITYILLQFSTSREVATSLIAPFPNITTNLPLFTGSYIDFLIIALTRKIFLPSTYYQTLHPYFLMIICNISPYLRSLAPLSAQSLIRLLEKFSAKSWLLEAPNNNYCLFYTLETINNIIQYQWVASAGLIIGLIRKKEMLMKVFHIGGRWKESKEEQGNEWRNKEWFDSWTNILPLDVCRGILTYMIPELEGFTKSNPKARDEEIIGFVNKTTLVGLLPPPPRIVTRMLEVDQQSERFELAYLWSYVYLKNLPYEIAMKDMITLVKYS